MEIDNDKSIESNEKSILPKSSNSSKNKSENGIAKLKQYQAPIKSKFASQNPQQKAKIDTDYVMGMLETENSNSKDPSVPIQKPLFKRCATHIGIAYFIQFNKTIKERLEQPKRPSHQMPVVKQDNIRPEEEMLPPPEILPEILQNALLFQNVPALQQLLAQLLPKENKI